MLLLCAEDFLEAARKAKRLPRETEKQLALEMKTGCPNARQAIIDSYLPILASHILRLPKKLQTLNTVYRCLQCLEKGVDTFNFQQDIECFSHHLCRRMRQCITACIADRA